MTESVPVGDTIDAPTDSESGDAPYNPDVWELRSRIDQLRAREDTWRIEHHDLRGQIEAAEAKLADAVLALKHCEDSNWRLTQRVLPAEAKLAAIREWGGATRPDSARFWEVLDGGGT